MDGFGSSFLISFTFFRNNHQKENRKACAERILEVYLRKDKKQEGLQYEIWYLFCVLGEGVVCGL